jgi:HprK-related kinase A
LLFRTGPFLTRLDSRLPALLDIQRLLYGERPPEDENQLVDFHVRVRRRRGPRGLLRPQAIFSTDMDTPFYPFPLEQAFPLFEWGLNYCIAMQAHQYLMLHSAVLERHGRVLLLPAPPGSGKSTLCAALAYRGWRLLSDEFGLLRPDSGLIDPIPRPIPLKNRSIEVFKAFEPDAIVGPLYPGTRKGDIAHVHPGEEALRRWNEAARPAWIVFPQYDPGATTRLHDFAKGRAFLKLSGNAFNYPLQGKRGFHAVERMIRECSTWYLPFRDLDEAVATLSRLADETADAS